MNIKYVHIQVVGVELHLLEHALERDGHAVAQRHHLLRAPAEGALDEAQQVFLVHAGGGVDVGVHFPGWWKHNV